MAEITITEALAELKTIGARIKKNRDAILAYAVRPADRKDPLEKDGGSEKFIQEKRQAIRDLCKRFVAIRTAIQVKNLASDLTLHDQTQTIQEWLNWRREIANGVQQFQQALSNKLAQERARVTQQNVSATIRGARAETVQAGDGNLTVAFSEKEHFEEVEKTEQLVGDLDGKLSLHNATVKITVAD